MFNVTHSRVRASVGGRILGCNHNSRETGYSNEEEDEDEVVVEGEDADDHEYTVIYISDYL